MNKTLALLLLALVGSAFACSCLPRSFSEHVTSADQVLRIKVLYGPFDVGISRFYVVRIKDIFKKTDAWNGDCGEIALVRTTVNSAACGVTFNLNTEYLVTAYGSANFMSLGIIDTNLCALQREWCTLDDCDRRILGDGKCGLSEVCTLEYRPVCAVCAGRRKTFGNDCAREVAGWKKVSDGECPTCIEWCLRNPMPLCFWGTPRCCKGETRRTGRWQCPSGGNPNRPGSWEYPGCDVCKRKTMDGVLLDGRPERVQPRTLTQLETFVKELDASTPLLEFVSKVRPVVDGTADATTEPVLIQGQVKAASFGTQ